MSVPEKLWHLLKGLNQDLYWGMAPLIPDHIDDTDKFLSAVNRFEMIEHRARSLSKSRYTEIPDQVPGRRKREDRLARQRTYQDDERPIVESRGSSTRTVPDEEEIPGQAPTVRPQLLLPVRRYRRNGLQG